MEVNFDIGALPHFGSKIYPVYFVCDTHKREWTSIPNVLIWSIIVHSSRFVTNAVISLVKTQRIKYTVHSPYKASGYFPM